jgi:hypothetical protein
VRDTLTGRGRRRFVARYHFHPDVLVEGVGMEWQCRFPDGARVALRTSVPAERVIGRPGAQPMGWFSPRFGDVVPTVTLECGGASPLPAERAAMFEPA